jgi:hypothetical protein
MTKFFLYAPKSTNEPNGQILSIEVIKKSRSGEAKNGTEKREYSSMLCLLDKIRTFFKQNPDVEF